MANSTPMVLLLSKLNSLRVNRDKRLLLPTPESPISTTGEGGRNGGIGKGGKGGGGKGNTRLREGGGGVVGEAAAKRTN